MSANPTERQRRTIILETAASEFPAPWFLAISCVACRRGKEQGLEAMAEWVQREPHAVSVGRLTRALRCSVCGKPATGRTLVNRQRGVVMPLR